MAMSLAVVRSWGEQAVFIMGQTSRCCMVCLMPQSQVSCSVENPHLNMFTLDRPTCVRNRLSAFQVVQGFSAPAGRCSSALMFRCTLASRGSSRSRHSSRRAAFAVVLMGLVHVIKLFRDLRHHTTPRCPLSGVPFVRSLPCPFRTTCHRSPDVWWGDSGNYGQTVGICRLQTSCDHSTGFIQCRVQFICMGGAFPHRASILCS